ncbi:MAG: glycoside hydrolase family 5 protein [Prevotellaceae bacterium]|nr:glycoside hydrolase family 5 protein [Prevotellaceae bacterium]
MTKKGIVILCFAWMLAACSERIVPVEEYGQLSVKDSRLVDAQGNTMSLKGVAFGWHNYWPRFYNATAVKTLAEDWGCTVVRASIGVEPRDGYIDKPEVAMQCLYNVVDAAIANGVYVIVDWHTHHIKLEESKKFFTDVATKYKDYPNIIYEIYNEPVDDTWEAVKAYSEEMIRTIRAIDPNQIILVGCPHWDQDIHIVADDPITGYDNLIYTFHFYAGTHNEELRERGVYAISRGLPLFISECAGTEATGDGPIAEEEWDNWMKWIRDNDLSWCAWSIADKNETSAMLTPEATDGGPWSRGAVKEWGRIIKKELGREDEINR